MASSMPGSVSIISFFGFMSFELVLDGDGKEALLIAYGDAPCGFWLY